MRPAATTEISQHKPRIAVHAWKPAGIAALVAVLIAFPTIATWLDEAFYVGFVSRVMIFALAVSSLNLILGYGGMISLGHAAYLGAGAYTIGILAQSSVVSAWIAWPAAMMVSALLALVIGAISLRTKGIYFIMITLAFAQMIYYVVVSLKMVGGDDGMNLAERSRIGFGLDLAADATFYYVVLAITVVVLCCMHRVVNSRFGGVLRGIRENEARMQAIGYDTYRYELTAFVIGGALAGLAGALLANQNAFISPNLLNWLQSGTLLMMLILGGVGYLWGGVLGAAAFLLMEEVLSSWTPRWQFAMGAILIVLVLFAPRGLSGLLSRKIGK